MVLTLLHITSHLIFLCYVGSNMHYNKIMYAHDIFIIRALNEIKLVMQNFDIETKYHKTIFHEFYVIMVFLLY